MENIYLQFQGAAGWGLLLALSAAVAVAVLAWAAWQLYLRRWRYGAICMAAALGPVLAPALLVSAAERLLRRDARAARRNLLAALVLGVGIIAAATLAVMHESAAAAWMALLGVQITAAIGVFYLAVYSHLGSSRLAVLMALRVAAIVALLLILFKPVLTIASESGADRKRIAVLVDNSRSMSVADDASFGPRYSQAVAMLRTQQRRIEREFRPAWYHFAAAAPGVEAVSDVRSLDALAGVAPAGDGTDLAAALRAAVAGADRGDFAGIVLISDGIHNAQSLVLDAAVETGVPVFALGVGGDAENISGAKNIELSSIDAPLDMIVNNANSIGVRVKMTGLPNAAGEIRLLDADTGAVLDSQRLWTDKNADTLSVSLKYTPKEGARDGADAPAAGDVRRLRVDIPVVSGESVEHDNAADLHVLVTQPRVRVLYVEGTMRPEYKFLHRLLASDPNVQYVALVRVEGSRFWSQGSIGGRRLEKLPVSDDEFAMFDVIIIGDLDATFLTRDQLGRIRRFVNEGGALLMIGGQSCFGPGGYGETELEQALPVTVGTRAAPQESVPFLPQLTAVGEAHPVFAGIAGFFGGAGGRAPSDELPRLKELMGCVAVPAAKPAAAVLAVHPSRSNDDGPLTVLAVHNYGSGRSAAFTADTTWQWFLPMRGLGADSPYQRFWGQLIRYLANVEIRSREQSPAVMLRFDPPYVRSGDAMKIVARVQHKDSTTVADAAPRISVMAPQADKAEELPVSATMAQGIYETSYRPAVAGEYKFTATIADTAGEEAARDELALTAWAQSAEMDRLARNDALLKLVADRSGGRFAELSALPEVIDQIVARQGGAADRVRGRDVPLYNFTLLFVVFVAMLTSEWLLRRSWQLH